MSRKSDIEALINRAEKSLSKIIEEYEKSLHSKTIPADLKIDIKDYFGNLRSILDYLAHDIVEKYCPKAKPKDSLYFPICQDHVSFETLMQKSYPDLKTTSKSVYDILESIQPFKNAKNQWLIHFNKLNNENKHERLVAQTIREKKRINVQTKSGARHSWNPSVVKFGSGAFISGVPVNPQTQMPFPSDTQTVTVETWADFQFDDINVSAIWLTKVSLSQIRHLYDRLKSEI